MIIPALLQKSVPRLYGEYGRKWLRELPDLISRYADKWHLVVGDPYVPGGWKSLVLQCQTADGSQAVLKLGYDTRLLEQQARALQCWQGNGAVRLYRSAPQALLLEKISPGKSANINQTEGQTLSSPVNNSECQEQSLDRALRIAPQLWLECPSPAACNVDSPVKIIGSVAEYSKDWIEAMDQWTNNNPGMLSPLPSLKYLGQWHEQLISSDEHILLHGDLHTGNILSYGQDEWRVIDPEPLIGPRAYDVTPLLAAVINDPTQATQLLNFYVAEAPHTPRGRL